MLNLSFLKTPKLLPALALGAGLGLLAIGSAQAARHHGDHDRAAAMESCKTEMKADLKGREARNAMRDCMHEKRSSMRETRMKEHEGHRAAMKTCRNEVKDQKLTEAERHDAIKTCIGKTDPKLAKMMGCRDEARAKDLKRHSSELRAFMQGCINKA